ncbi:hypothetical protein DVA67_015960 [Solirubrobacter sp. CPCC 204708]|uniref:Uncharacterized protein n=1 Tax=Solirubrobacter deserti TaxID=2282478 RepID=A0ABT4RP59_9ACTN|nr:hypothetical protein [Solirubrobacter deserti]MBE2317479.1 hypothetical protein [Solirubrobacter deserti]MDA0140343.1 hypothetical protein [Solirubrobacter deserti]
MRLAALAIAGCPIFPASSPWNQRVDDAPVHPRSDAMVRAIGLDDPVHPDFGSGGIGIPFQVVGERQRRSKVSFQYASESDRGPYPIPRRPRIERGSDRHLLLVQRGSCRLFELFAAERREGAWHAGSGAIFNLRSNRLRPEGWTSADAAGLPILPGLARYDEVARGEIRHALRFTVQRTRRAFVFPARHYASSLTDPDLPAMGQRLRLKASVDVSGMPRQARVVATALQRYGMLLADNGSDWFISGAPDPRWDNDALRALKRLKGSDFEVVSEAAR